MPQELVLVANRSVIAAHSSDNHNRGFWDIHAGDYATPGPACRSRRGDFARYNVRTSNPNCAHMSHFEIEIKSLLGEASAAEALKAKMAVLDPALTKVGENKQRNHYFEGGDMEQLYANVEHLFSGEQHEKLKKIIERGKEFSIRSRQKDEQILLVLKASIDEGTSANTVKRMEFEEPVAITLDELDALLLKAGFSYQAKWSREREEYAYKGASVCFDKNAGYGYLAEFEKIVHDENEADAVRAELDVLMQELGVEELDQDRLARMFDFYNKNWPDYYGTDKTFVIV